MPSLLGLIMCPGRVKAKVTAKPRLVFCTLTVIFLSFTIISGDS